MLLIPRFIVKQGPLVENGRKIEVLDIGNHKCASEHWEGCISMLQSSSFRCVQFQLLQTKTRVDNESVQRIVRKPC